MGFWIKHFIDGSNYQATDREVAMKKASWRNSRNKDIICVELEHQNIMLRIFGPGEYWQSDTYESIYPGYSNQLTHRRIQKKIENTDKFLTYISTDNLAQIYFNKKCGHDLIPVLPSWENRWFVLEHSIKDNSINYYIKDQKN